MKRKTKFFIYTTDGEARLQGFITSVQKKAKIDHDTLSFVADSLAQILDGVPPKKALNLNRKRGRKQPNTLDLDFRSAVAIQVIARMKPYGNMTRDQAIEETAQLLETTSEEAGKKLRTVRRYYDEHRAFAKQFIQYYDDNPKLAFANLLGLDLIPDNGPTIK